MSTYKLHHVIAFGMLAAGTLSSSASIAATAVATPQHTVRYADLDLAKPGDAKVLYFRIKQAAAAVCNDFDVRSLAHQAQRRHCIKTAVNHAVANVNAPLLTQLHDARREVRLASAN